MKRVGKREGLLRYSQGGFLQGIYKGINGVSIDEFIPHLRDWARDQR